MTDRRTFLKTGITALALPTVARTAFSVPVYDSEEAKMDNLITPYKVIYDERFQDSVAFADAAARLGTTTHGIRGDITDLWYHDLYHEWKEGPAPIMGMTDEASLFCLQTLAQDQRMRVVFRVDHSFLSDNQIEHVISGTTGMPKEVSNLCDDGMAWNVRMSNVVLQCSDNHVKPDTTRIVTRLERKPSNQDKLVSWVIAPVRKA